MTNFERLERMFCGNVERIASAIDGFGGPAFAGYSSESRTIRVGREHDSIWSYYNPMVSVVRMTEGEDGSIDVLFETYRRTRACADGTFMHMRLEGKSRRYRGKTACHRALRDASGYLGAPPRFLQRIFEETEEK